MIFKIVLLFLVVIGVLGMFGKYTVPGAKQVRALRKRVQLDAKKCPDCGRYKIGSGPCDCKKGPH